MVKNTALLGINWGIVFGWINWCDSNHLFGQPFLFFATEMIGNNQIRLLKIDGVFPDKRSIKNKTYPLTADFYAVTAGSKNPNTEALIKWILSPQGQYLVDKTGYIPIN